MSFEAVIGLEVHAQLSTASKLFCGCPTSFGATPNAHTCEVCLGMPGALPVANAHAVALAVRAALALECRVHPESQWARKNYFYPDLPKGYQISQLEYPYATGGRLAFEVDGRAHTVGLTRIHMEEDAGKSIHDDAAAQGRSLVDFNRGGTPFIEIVSEPELRSPQEAAAYMRTLHHLLRFLGVCDGNMEEGNLRCDANVSIRPAGSTTLGTRTELKNLNSFRFLQQAIDFEVQWQIDLIEDGGQVQQATVLFDPDSGETRAMRSKEDAHDYRYFPDPDLPPLLIEEEWVERVRAHMPELPRLMAARFQQDYGLPPYDAAMMTQSKAFGSYFEAVARASGQAKLTANWLMGEVSRRLNAEGLAIDACPLAGPALARLIARIADGTLSNNGARQVFDVLWTDAAGEVDSIIESRGLRQVNDTAELEQIIDQVLAANPKSVDEFRAGKDKAFNALVGQAMKASKGKANPASVSELLRRKLN